MEKGTGEGGGEGARPRGRGGGGGCGDLRKVVVESTCCRQCGLSAFLRTSCAALTSISPSRSSSPVLLLGRVQQLLHSARLLHSVGAHARTHIRTKMPSLF